MIAAPKFVAALAKHKACTVLCCELHSQPVCNGALCSCDHVGACTGVSALDEATLLYMGAAYEACCPLMLCCSTICLLHAAELGEAREGREKWK